MKPSRKPVAHEPVRLSVVEKSAKTKTPKWPGMCLTEIKLWHDLDSGEPGCPRCDGLAERVVKVGKGYELSCWTDHG